MVLEISAEIPSGILLDIPARNSSDFLLFFRKYLQRILQNFDFFKEFEKEVFFIFSMEFFRSSSKSYFYKSYRDSFGNSPRSSSKNSSRNMYKDFCSEIASTVPAEASPRVSSEIVVGIASVILSGFYYVFFFEISQTVTGRFLEKKKDFLEKSTHTTHSETFGDSWKKCLKIKKNLGQTILTQFLKT